MRGTQAFVNQKAIIIAKNKILTAFASDPFGEHRATTKVTRRLLLDAPYLIQGLSCEIIAKSLGAGVYKLTLERKEKR